MLQKPSPPSQERLSASDATVELDAEHLEAALTSPFTYRVDAMIVFRKHTIDLGGPRRCAPSGAQKDSNPALRSGHGVEGAPEAVVAESVVWLLSYAV